MATISVLAVDKVLIIGFNGITDNFSYQILQAAFVVINAQGNKAGKDIEIQIGGNTIEKASVALNQEFVPRLQFIP